MKKHAIAATWAFALSLVVLFTTINTAEANTPLPDRSLSLMNLALELKTPESLAKYMWRHFVFEKDQSQFGQNEYWQKPEEFLQNKKGDCEDFALFAREILKLNGLNSFLLNIYSDGSGHTVCVFKNNGTYSIIDGTDILHTQSSDLKEVIQELKPFWKSAAIVTSSSSSPEGRILTTITR